MSTNEAKSTPNPLAPLDESPIFMLEPKQQRFVHLYTTGQYTLQKIADLLELHPNTLSNWLKREDVKLALTDITLAVHDQVSTELKMLTLKASRKLNELIDSPIDGVALQAVNSILDRSGHKSKQEIKIDKTVTTIEEKFKELLDSTIVDADFEEVAHD